jgi:hypothetical protein
MFGKFEVVSGLIQTIPEQRKIDTDKQCLTSCLCRKAKENIILVFLWLMLNEVQKRVTFSTFNNFSGNGDISEERDLHGIRLLIMLRNNLYARR